MKTTGIVFEEEIVGVRNQARENATRERRTEDIGKKFFNFEYGIVMNPTGESVDKNIKNAAIDGAIEMMLAAPAVVNTPLFKQKLANNGIPPFRLTVEEQQQLEQSATGEPIPDAPEDKLSQLAAQ